MTPASPIPVTIPMRPHICWMTIMNGEENQTSQSWLYPKIAPVCE